MYPDSISPDNQRHTYDDLTEQVRDRILDMGRDDFDLDWQTEPGWVTCSIECATDIIALVRADEQRRIREALLSYDAIQTMLEAGGFPKNAMEQRAFDRGLKEMQAALTAIDLTEEPS